MKNLEEKQWDTIFSLPHIIINETKICVTQYKILNNIINCRTKLKDWKIVESNLCPHCNKIDDILHFFLFCKKTKIFWNSLIRWWNNNFNPKIETEREDIKENLLFGFMSNDLNHQVLDILGMKHYLCHTVC